MKHVEGLLLLGIFVASVSGAEDFPSLISANASIAIVLDRDYLGDEYSSTLESIKEYMKDLTREELRHGGVNVHYYSWTSITLKSDLTAIMSVASCRDTWRLHATARAERVALLAVTGADCPRLPRGGSLAVPLVPRGEELPQLTLDVRTSQAFDWKAAVVLHDDTLNRDMVSRVVTAMTVEVEDKTVSAVAVSVFKMKHENDATKRKMEIGSTLSKLRLKFTGENFAVIVTTDVMMSVMEVAKSMNLVHPKAQWLYFISDTDGRRDNLTVISNQMGEGENVAIVYNVTIDEPYCKSGLVCQCRELLRGFVLSLDRAIQDEVRVASQVSDEEWEAIRPNKQQRGVAIVEEIEKYLSINSVCNNCSSWRIRSSDAWGTVFQKNNTLPKSGLLQVGYWRPVDGLRMTDEMFPHVEHGFRGRHLPIVAIHNPPWSILALNDSANSKQNKGLVFDIVNELSQNLNFTYSVILPSQMRDEFMNESFFEGAIVILEWKGGVKLTPFQLQIKFPLKCRRIRLASFKSSDAEEQRKASIEDAFRILESRGVLLAASAFTVTQDRKRRVNFTMPVSIQTYAFLVSRPRELSRVLLFMAPFASDTWLCLGCSVVLMGPTLFIVHHLSPFYDEHVNIKRGGLATLHNCFWYMYGALLQQGGMYLPRADSGRLVVGTWWLVVLVVVTTYCGNLVAFLTFPRQESPVTSVGELLGHSDTLTWGMRRGTFLEDCLKETDEVKFKSLYSGAMLHDGETMESIELVRQGRHALVDWKINLQYIMKKEFLETDRCDFALSTEEFADEHMSMAVGKNSPYLAMINEEIKRMHQTGLIEKWLSEYLPNRDRCWNVGKVAEVNNHTVNMDDMQGCFFVLFLGFFAALLVIGIEWLCRKRRVSIDSRAVRPFAN